MTANPEKPNSEQKQTNIETFNYQKEYPYRLASFSNEPLHVIYENA